MASAYPQDSSLVQRHKRRGAALSCAECRRLKLKCSRVFPCSNCVKKGCGPICPDGSLTTGKGNRFVLANTEALHDKIGQLSTRVRQLEDALAESHSLNSPHPHPLLSEELLQIKRPLERERLDEQTQKENHAENADAINALGSLSLSERGRSSFFGQAANSWYLLKNEEGSEEDDDLPTNFEITIPMELPWLEHAFPFTPSVSRCADEIRHSLHGYLPSASVARRLSEQYYRHAAWMYMPISQKDYFDTIFRPVYEQEYPYGEAINSHSLALLFMVLAMGALMDLELPAHSPEAIQYYQLAKAALSINSVFEEQSIPGIQALFIMCHFMFWNDTEARWVMMGIIVKLAQSVGLHRDSGKWNLDPEESYRRRCLLWELYVYDSWQSLTYGRPPSFANVHVDAKFPQDAPGTHNANGEMSFSAWKYTFASECLSIVHDQAFGARPPSYKTLQDLDRKVRSYYVPPSLQVPGFGGARMGPELEQPSTQLTMQRYIAFAIKEITLFYMHRGFFAQALEDHPLDPMGSKYAQSVLAAYTSACSFVGLVESLFKQHPALTERMWFLFTHVFSCAIVLGSIAMKAQMALAPSALSHLESAHQLFSQVSESSRTVKILAVLQKLKERAHTALSKVRGLVPPDPISRPYPAVRVKEEVDEFAALGGTTRLVSRRTSSLPSSPSSQAGSSPVSQPASPPGPGSPITQEPQGGYQSMQESVNQWQTYTPQPQQEYQLAEYPLYPNVPLQSESAMVYNIPQNQHGMTLDVMPEYYGYSNGNGANVRVGYGQYTMQHPGEYSAPPDHDLQVSWSNFMAQYKQI
ncbi:fungal-specific transcription factor domain-containing protein [Desarmillaria tabescens]|uniref:Fungal-specific transcription factor domain-containing protein n=1 Tax=Armillaria tabescens TaxID=1929756 RepID=A0AA39NKC8_ARMTA|nr:fungal-specific transcription factor domain-containing protein [Desarmillaria tabescens]KAK0467253.1 fungal-specific transcription factor domain-containing protein [Desarmillaria tabescens]